MRERINCSLQIVARVPDWQAGLCIMLEVDGRARVLVWTAINWCGSLVSVELIRPDCIMGTTRAGWRVGDSLSPPQKYVIMILHPINLARTQIDIACCLNIYRDGSILSVDTSFVFTRRNLPRKDLEFQMKSLLLSIKGLQPKRQILMWRAHRHT